MINEDQSSKICFGCRLCQDICPRKSISFTEDKHGFLCLKIDEELCSDCELCEKACPVLNMQNLKNMPIEAYAAIHKDAAILAKSSSGGVFGALADIFLNRGGWVCGCVWDDNINPVHICTDKKEEVERMHGSKYVQSNMSGIYKQVKQKLTEGRYVLFTGTPCQAAALKLFLGKDYEKLLIVDLICHGIASSALWQAYLKNQSERLGGTITGARFRDKKKGWGHNFSFYYLKNGKEQSKTLKRDSSSYLYYYLKGYSYRESCYKCPFAVQQRVGDITVGDYWGIKEIMPDVPTRYGVSALMFNTQKAMQYLPLIEKSMTLYKSSIEDVSKNNKNLNQPTPKPEDRKELFTVYESGGYDAIEKLFEPVAARYRKNERIKVLKKAVKRITPKSILDFYSKRKRDK